MTWHHSGGKEKMGGGEISTSFDLDAAVEAW